MRWVRRLLFWLGLANLALAVLVVLASSLATGITYTVAVSTYGELDKNGVVDHDRLAETWGPEYVDNSYKVVDRLVGESLLELYENSKLVAGLFGLNGLILLLAWWRMRTVTAIVAVAGLCSATGCGPSRAAMRATNSPPIAVARVWFSPDDPTPAPREDGEGLFPAPWPAAALIVPVGPFWNDIAEATLFLLAAEDLTEANAASRIPSATRFAKECRLPARGRWISLTGRSLPVFIFLYDSGGTAGLNVEVFSRLVSYAHGWPARQSEAFQNHSFQCVFRGQSRLPPCLADTNGDGTLELLVASEVTNASGAEGTPRIYDVWAWRNNGFDSVGELPAEEVESLEDRIPL